MMKDSVLVYVLSNRLLVQGYLPLRSATYDWKSLSVAQQVVAVLEPMGVEVLLRLPFFS